MPLVEPGPLHRLALAVDNATDVEAWFRSVLGAGPLESDLFPEDRPSGGGGGGADLEGTEISLFRVGGFPVILLAKGVPGGPVARFLERYGPGVQSLAWEVDDMWTVQNLLIERGIRIGAVNIPGRHFFMHPKDTDGILMEWTDDTFGENAKRTSEGGGAVDVTTLAWVTAVVNDAEATAAMLGDLAAGTEVTGNPQGPSADEVTVDVRVGDLTIRLVTPTSADSRYQAVTNTPRLCSFTYKVEDLDASLSALEGLGVGTAYRQDGLAATDPASTFGLPFEWTA